MKTRTNLHKKPTAEAQLKRFISKFDPAHQTLIRSVRKALRKRLPTANELAYDNYNFFVIGYGPTERPSDCIVSIAAGVTELACASSTAQVCAIPKKLFSAPG